MGSGKKASWGLPNKEKIWHWLTVYFEKKLLHVPESRQKWSSLTCRVSAPLAPWKQTIMMDLRTACAEPVFVNLLRSPGIDLQPGGPVQQPYLPLRPARLHRLAESISRIRFLGSLIKRVQIRGQPTVTMHYSLKSRGTSVSLRVGRTWLTFTFPKKDFSIHSIYLSWRDK